MRSLAFAAALTLAAAGPSCSKKAGTSMSTKTTLPSLASELHLTFPKSARLLGFGREQGMDDLLRVKVEMSSADLPGFLAAAPVPAGAYAPGEGGLLGPDDGFWDPHQAKHLRTGQVTLPDARALNIGVDDGGGAVAVVYIVNHGT